MTNLKRRACSHAQRHTICISLDMQSKLPYQPPGEGICNKIDHDSVEFARS